MVQTRRMLSVLPRRVHLLVLRAAHGMRVWWWRRTGASVRGCTVIAANAQGEVLLVRHTYHAPDVWMLPGGGLGRSESPERTAMRELAEEVGCLLAAPCHIATFTIARRGWTNHLELVAGTTSDEPCPDGREILEARFFHPECLPERANGPTREMIGRWLELQNGSSG
ncbi:MAG: NUDIX domain-containing protein [Novosphingobium meiothermophilum]